MNPRVSVVIPALNAEATIAEAVRAIVTQPVPQDNFECIVVDDGSRDLTAEAAGTRRGHRGSPDKIEAAPPRATPASSTPAANGLRSPMRTAFPRAAGCPPCWRPRKPPTVRTLALAGKTIGLDSPNPRRPVHGPDRRA